MKSIEQVTEEFMKDFPGSFPLYRRDHHSDRLEESYVFQKGDYEMDFKKKLIKEIFPRSFHMKNDIPLIRIFSGQNIDLVPVRYLEILKQDDYVINRAKEIAQKYKIKKIWKS